MIPRVTGKCFLTSVDDEELVPVDARSAASAGLGRRCLRPDRHQPPPPASLRAASAPRGPSSPGRDGSGRGAPPLRRALAASSGSSSWQTGITYGQRGWKRQPGGGMSSDGGWPGICTSRSTSWSSRGSEPSRPHVYGWCGRWKRSSHVALLLDAGGVHDDDVVGDLGDDAEVVGDHDDRAAELVLQALHQVEDLRLGGHVERRGRLVGDQQVGVVDERHRDHHALAHAARELVRVVVDALLGARDADRLQQLERARPARPPSSRPGGAGSPRRAAARSCAPGSATSSGPGRSSRSRCRGSRAACCGLIPIRFSPFQSASPLEIVFRRVVRPMIVRQVTLLPQPDSPTMPSVWPFSTVKLTPSTALTMPSSVRKYVFRSLTSRSAIVSGGTMPAGSWGRSRRRGGRRSG